MARGWESKSVEEQINAREDRAQESRKVEASKAEMVQRSRREGLQLARARTLTALSTASDQRYRSQLEQALSFLDTQIAELQS